MRATPVRIATNSLRVRDYLLVRLITGATKAATHVDRRKENNRRACRRRRPTTDPE